MRNKMCFINKESIFNSLNYGRGNQFSMQLINSDMKIFILNVFIFFGAAFLTAAQNSEQKNGFEIEYPEYFSKHDIVYKSPSYEGFEGFPIGNGDLGGLIWTTPSGIKMQINKSDTFDGTLLRSCGQLEIDFSAPVFDWLYLKDFDGRLSLHNATASFISETPMAKIIINSIVAINDNLLIIEVEKLENQDYLGGSPVKIGLERWGSRPFRNWYARSPEHNPEIEIGGTKAGVDDEIIYFTEQFEEMHFAVAGKVIGQNASAETVNYHRAELKTNAFKSGKMSLVVSVATSKETSNPLEFVKTSIKSINADNIARIRNEHQDWWHSFWQRSFLHLPDEYIENIYYLKRYILASSSRGKYPALFNSAIFTWNHDVRNWIRPHHWNMQQIYWGILPSGDDDLLKTYIDAHYRLIPAAEKYALEREAENAILWNEIYDFQGNMLGKDTHSQRDNFTPASQMAGFFWEYYKYTGDQKFLKEKGYPFMKKAAEFYLQKLRWDNGKKEYYLSPCQPYESPQAHNLSNCITDRVMIESSFKNCIKASEILQTDRSKRKEWKNVIDHLWEPPMMPAKYSAEKEWSWWLDNRQKMQIPEGTGNLFAQGYKADGSVTPDSTEAGDWLFHFSANTAAVFPSNLVGLDQQGSSWFNAAANAVSIHPHYRNAISPDPVVAARLGMGNESLDMIENSIRRLQHFPQGMFYNLDHWYIFSLYSDSLKRPEYSAMRDYVYDSRIHYNKAGGNSGLPAKPFVQFGMEPLGTIGAALNEMMLQSVEGKIRIFPSMPAKWKNNKLAFKLWAENGFLVSALRKESGETTLSIESKLGKDCVLQNPWAGKQLYVRSFSGEVIKVINHGNDVYSFPTQKGEVYIITPDDIKLSGNSDIFTGQRNNGPKYFQEAVLGKKQNF